MTQVLDFCKARFNIRIFSIGGLVQRDLWGPLRPGKISGHGLSQYSFLGITYAKSAMIQVLVILRGISENRLFGALTGFSGCRIWGVLPSSPKACRDQWGHQTVDMTKTCDICQNCDDASPRFFRPNCTFGC